MKLVSANHITRFMLPLQSGLLADGLCLCLLVGNGILKGGDYLCVWLSALQQTANLITPFAL